VNPKIKETLQLIKNNGGKITLNGFAAIHKVNRLGTVIDLMYKMVFTGLAQVCAEDEQIVEYLLDRPHEGCLGEYAALPCLEMTALGKATLQDAVCTPGPRAGADVRSRCFGSEPNTPAVRRTGSMDFAKWPSVGF